MPTEDKLYALHNLSIYERSLVQNPAVGSARIILAKNKDGKSEVEITKPAEILKSSEAERKIYGYVLTPDSIDEQGHTIAPEEIKKAVDQYNRNLAMRFQKGTGTGWEHQVFDDSIAYPILNVYDETGEIAKAIGIPDDKIIKKAWLTGDQLTEKGYDMYQSGKITGWSIGGAGEQEYITKSIDNIEKSVTSQSLPKWLPNFIVKVQTLFNEELPNLSEDIINWMVKNVVSDALLEVKYQIFSDMETSNNYFEYSSKPNNDVTTLNKAKEKDKTKKKEGFFKKLFKKSKEGDSLEKEEVSKMIDDKLNPIVSSIEKLSKSISQSESKTTSNENTSTDDKTETTPEKSSQSNDNQNFTELKKSFDKLEKRIEELSKSKAQSTQLENDDKVETLTKSRAFNVWDIKEDK